MQNVARRFKSKKLRYNHSSENGINRFSYIIIVLISAQTYQSVCTGPTHHASEIYGSCVCTIPPQADLQDNGIVPYQANLVIVIIID